MSELLLEMRKIGFGYPGHRILHDADFALGPAERVALVGPNGAGKTTLLHLLVGLRRPVAGQVLAFGRACRSEADFVAVRARVGLVFQDADDQLFCPTVLEDVAFGPLNLGRTPAQAREDAEYALSVLGLEPLATRVSHRLSGGQKRLVALATVLAMRPQVLLLDEPTNGLDEATERRLVDHLEGLEQAMVIVSHDRRLLERLATRAVSLADGQLAEATLHSHPHLHRHAHLHVHAPGVAADHAHQGAVPRHDDHHRSRAATGDVSVLGGFSSASRSLPTLPRKCGFWLRRWPTRLRRSQPVASARPALSTILCRVGLTWGFLTPIKTKKDNIVDNLGLNSP